MQALITCYFPAAVQRMLATLATTILFSKARICEVKVA